ncbi:MAG: Stk1 family PASTA domain-containing Ser/Thr kinase [Acidimicrobiales bacterium]|nr:Stk1 family PASTA domain-containing Ser/Thr kinase [Acidimicrobiales bacterium]
MTQTGIVFNDRYQVTRQLGRGGMADVYLAHDQLLERPVAVKVLFPEYAADPAFVERFRREAQAAANLNHPNIVGVYDWGQQGGTYFIVMEYVDGRSLADILRADGPLPPNTCADIADQVAAALGFAHRNGVVHRDVKPGNALITPAGHVKVADFGIARALNAGDDGLTRAGLVMGTATYFSPEQAQGLAVDQRSDLYSLGVVMYECLTGYPPFAGDTAVAIAYQHVQQPPVPLRQVDVSVPPGLEAVVLKLLAKNPVDRYATADDLRGDLKRFREGRAVLADPALTPGGATGAHAIDPTVALGATRAVGAVPDPTQVAPPGGTGAYPPTGGYGEPRRRRSTAAFVMVLLVLLAALVAVLVALSRTLGGDSTVQVTVPNVVNQPADAARASLEAAGFRVRTESGESDAVEPGLVFEQDPAGNTDADEGSEVVIRVNQGPAPVQVESYVGLTEEDAVARIEVAGLVADVTREPSDQVPSGQVIRQDPEAGQEVAANGSVRIVVSTGADLVVVPNLEGRGADAARQALQGDGFIVDELTQASDVVPAGRVIGTDPSAGTELSPGAVVTLIVSGGPAETTTTTESTTTTSTTTTTLPPPTATVPPTITITPPSISLPDLGTSTP